MGNEEDCIYKSSKPNNEDPNISRFSLYIMEKIIRKTCLYNFDTLNPHFYIVKLGFTGVYIIFLISARKHGLGGSNEYPQSMFLAEI